jgi:CRISPR-associated protein Cmr3
LPPPSVIYGAMRTAIATQNDIPFGEVPEKLDKNTFRITALHYKIAGDTVLPLPLDLVEYDKSPHIKEAEEDKKRHEVKPLILVKTSGLVTKAAKKSIFHLQATGHEPVEEIENGFIVTTELEQYLEGHLDTTKALKLTDYILNEPKIGIGRDDLTNGVEEGLLYRTDIKRSNDLQIGVSFDLAGYRDLSPLVRLGGEGKLAFFSTTCIPFRAIGKAIAFRGNRFKIYFSTPALLVNGVPDLSRFLGMKATLVAACVGKAVPVGGFDMVARQPKPMYRAVPAGSVFYYESETDVSLLNNRQGVSMSDERQEEGFGIAYFGTWDAVTQ